jgi:hypothetical protein
MQEDPVNHTVIDVDFCARLEYKLTRALQASDDPDLKGWWCDGVIASIDHFEKIRSEHGEIMIHAIAFLGLTGQENYELSLHFGSVSLRCLRQGKRIDDLLPSEPFDEWATIDLSRKSLTVYLP